jgi:hypothetical protein
MAAYIVSHSGIKGMHWGVRRFQNEDGSLTAAGRARYGDGGAPNGSSGGTDGTSSRKAKVKKALKVAAGVAVAAGAAYGAYRLSKHPAVAAAMQRGVNTINSVRNRLTKNNINSLPSNSEMRDIVAYNNRIGMRTLSPSGTSFNGRTSQKAGTSRRSLLREVAPSGSRAFTGRGVWGDESIAVQRRTKRNSQISPYMSRTWKGRTRRGENLDMIDTGSINAAARRARNGFYTDGDFNRDNPWDDYRYRYGSNPRRRR